MPSRPLLPRIEAQAEFNRMMELYDKGRELPPKVKIEAIIKFLQISHPEVEKQIRWGWLFKSQNQAIWSLEVLHWGLDQFRDGKAFMRSGPTRSDTWGFSKPDFGKFDDGIVWDRSHGRAVRAASNDPCHLFLTRVFELLTEVAPWLRVCQREDCRRFFLFQRPKQIYCSEQCAQRVRTARFLARRVPAPPVNRGIRGK
jgi:hypothetical protein